MELFFATSMKACAQSSKSVYRTLASCLLQTPSKSHILLQPGLLLHLDHFLGAVLRSLYFICISIPCVKSQVVFCLIYPFRIQPSWQDSIDSRLWTLRTRQTLHQMQLCSLGDAVWHATPRRVPASDRGGHDEDTSFSVGFECGFDLAHEDVLGFDVHCVAIF